MMKSKLFWPLVMLGLILLLNLVINPSFFVIEVRNGHLTGSLINILNRGAPLILISIGMTLVIATKGIDLGVGSVIAMSGAIAATVVGGSFGASTDSLTPLFLAILFALMLAIVTGLWNGLLISRLGIQPIVATLILMVAGRGIAQLITNGQITTVYYSPYSFIGGGYLFMLPFSIFIVLFVLFIAMYLTRKTAIGLFIESVGGNPTASRLAGIQSKNVILMVYMFCGLCAGIAGLILSSNVMSADGNNAGLWYELDAILAVVIGGTSLMGGRFYLMGTVIGALIIQSLTTTIYSIGVPADIILVVKALVVLLVCLLQSPQFRERVSSMFSRKKTVKNKGKEVTIT
ncbi:ABC transporter permease [Halalkalibacter hemicellulosilyticus]|uniref:Sugar ABC transport system n=1 Tax=Halalkalibacter hemicellulosilyticusJCM 9152 TaxID=1236971 RepID=W4QHX2_9BACI|nr:ABC transporter permease [Halalkalibacter hemicellulosilyticus]GAE31701.1 sugar ABC transport system [Halalkalibacter hemicellulosilyticusJCM 9152]